MRRTDAPGDHRRPTNPRKAAGRIRRGCHTSARGGSTVRPRNWRSASSQSSTASPTPSCRLSQIEKASLRTASSLTESSLAGFGRTTADASATAATPVLRLALGASGTAAVGTGPRRERVGRVAITRSFSSILSTCLFRDVARAAPPPAWFGFVNQATLARYLRRVTSPGHQEHGAANLP